MTSSNANIITWSIEPLEDAAYIPKAEALTQIQDSLGVYNLSSISFSGEPGTRVKLSLNSSAITPSLSGHSSYSFSIEIQFRNCLAGE